MRSFVPVRALTSVILTAALFALAGCPTEGDDDGGYVCGDGICSVGDGESEFNCREDCASPVCGDGFCDSGETSQNCLADCPAPPACGDGACNGNETTASCPGDCPAPRCGDGACNGSENASSCPGDCAVCTGSFPVDCHDGTGCWSSGTNCSSNVFTCSGLRRCASTNDWAFCCGGAFLTCPGSAPYFCPQDGLCYPGNGVPSYCNVTGCSVILGDC